MKILIAEDDATSRDILAHVLRQLGHEVVETANGEEAWAVFQREHVSLLVSAPDVDLVIGKPITLPALRDALAIVK